MISFVKSVPSIDRQETVGDIQKYIVERRKLCEDE